MRGRLGFGTGQCGDRDMEETRQREWREERGETMGARRGRDGKMDIGHMRLGVDQKGQGLWLLGSLGKRVIVHIGFTTGLWIPERPSAEAKELS